MSKINRIKKKTNFVILEKNVLNDKRLSWGAKGLHSYIMGLPDDWQPYLEHLATVGKDGRTSTGTYMNELIEFGYVVRTKTTISGRFCYEYNVYEEAQNINDRLRISEAVKPKRKNRNGATEAEKQQLLNTESVNIELPNNKEENINTQESVCAPEISSFSFSEVKSENPTELEFGNPKHFSRVPSKIVNSEKPKQFSEIYEKAKQFRMSLRSFETEFEFISKKENPAELLNVLAPAIDNYEKALQSKYAGEIDKRYIKSFKNFVDEKVYEIYSVSFDVSDSNKEYVDYEGIKFEVIRTALNGKKYGNDLSGKEFQLTGAAGVKISLTNPQNTDELIISRIIKGQINQFKNHGK